MMKKRTVALFFSIVFVILVLVMPRTTSLNYDYKKGYPWKYETLISKFDFPVMKTESQILSEMSKTSSEVIPYFRYSRDAVRESLAKAEDFPLPSDVNPIFRPSLVQVMKDIYAKGVVSDDRNPSEVIYVQRDKRAEKVPGKEVYQLTAARSVLLSRLKRELRSEVSDSLLKSMGVADLLVVNLYYDSQTTDLVHLSTRTEVSPTDGYVNAGQVIVSSGEIVTAEIAQMIDSYRKEYEANIGYDKPRFLMWIGNILLALVLMAMLFFAIHFTYPEVFASQSSLLYILVVFLLAVGGSILAARLPGQMLYMVPFTLVALYLQAFFPNRVIISVYFVSLLPLLIFTNAGVPFYMMFLLAGIVTIYAFRFFNKGWKQFVMAAITFAVLELSFLAFWLLDGVDANPVKVTLNLVVSSLLSVAGYPLIYLFERIFNLVSGNRLIDMCDTSSGLLRELEKKAPGTFQHSLQVMNMADAAARSIKADTLLIRAGALYHDIGKMNNPLCFVENASLVADGNTYHEGMSPVQSAHDIMMHVTDGVDIAERNNIPRMVRDFIVTHHGTSLVSFFYSKHISSGGDPSIAGDFRYKGRRPQTKEQVILMLCDSIEAASRTLPDYTSESIDRFVERIVRQKMEEEQLADADISLKELLRVKESLKTYLAQIHHERIAYPTGKKITKQ